MNIFCQQWVVVYPIYPIYYLWGMAKVVKSGIQTPMGKLTQEYEKFIKGKELDREGKNNFSKAIKKAAVTKQRGSK